jgi:hypothetical protein
VIVVFEEYVAGYLIFWGLIWIVSMLVAHAIGKPKNRAGFLYGFLLSWIGVIIVALLPRVPEITLDELEKRRKAMSPVYYEKKKAELTAKLQSERIYRACPFCKENMRWDASVCPHCRHESDPWTLHQGYWWVRVDGKWYRLDDMRTLGSLLRLQPRHHLIQPRLQSADCPSRDYQSREVTLRCGAPRLQKACSGPE